MNELHKELIVIFVLSEVLSAIILQSVYIPGDQRKA